MRGFFTLAVSRDLYAGVPAVYVNYLDNDVTAHEFGPRSRPGLLSLRRVDRAIRQLARVVRRVPEYRYDLYILADQGQAPCQSYPALTGGRRFKRWVFEKFLDATPAETAEGRLQSGLAVGIREHRRATPVLFQRFLNYVDEEFVRGGDGPEAYQHNGVRVISAGPNAFLYVLGATAPLDSDALERRFPGLAEQLSQSTGVGFVLARSSTGPLCFRHGKRYQLGESDAGRLPSAPTPRSWSRASWT
jgi:hypothetical protein